MQKVLNAVAAMACTTGLMLASTTPVVAAEVQGRSQASSRQVLICVNDAATRRSFERQHGSSPIFITAREAVEARDGWATPRCMTAREHVRLVNLTQDYAAAR